ncbi:hypothetical protein GCM10010988_38520 [Cnuibacter physcomitrellae]|uniref:hypothetical protein n=1 Tax=Cnuibacter physcomitrellae TaxID=1619308 RepID=UPI00157DC3AA|nr:hypothetical protein [Cnuibacter physcomitrellae]GGI42336.1 hypothetical protein GCM10010988_38520 [Cnuibacter physcomitrellae]
MRTIVHDPDRILPRRLLESWEGARPVADLEDVTATLGDDAVLVVAAPSSRCADVCRQLRKIDDFVPLLAVVDTVDTDIRIGCLLAGADDVLPVDAEPSEWRLRLKALARRRGVPWL